MTEDKKNKRNDVSIYYWHYSQPAHFNVTFYREGEFAKGRRYENPGYESMRRLARLLNGVQATANIDSTTMNVHYKDVIS